jgi:hypothetical protein
MTFFYKIWFKFILTIKDLKVGSIIVKLLSETERLSIVILLLQFQQLAFAFSGYSVFVLDEWMSAFHMRIDFKE